MQKTDLAKQHKSYYTAKTKPEILEVEAAQYLSLTGSGDPSGNRFAACVQALYATAYALKFLCKANDRDFVVAKLEGQWWFDETRYGHVGMAEAPIKIPRSEWLFRLMIRIPDYVIKKELNAAQKQALAKAPTSLIAEVELYLTRPKKVVQMLHKGPFDKEPESLVVLRQFITEQKLYRAGHHHEVYLSDFRKTAPEKLRTILREEVR